MRSNWGERQRQLSICLSVYLSVHLTLDSDQCFFKKDVKQGAGMVDHIEEMMLFFDIGSLWPPYQGSCE